jgi:hypothetical protein
MTDTDLLADHMIWASTTEAAHDEVFNIVKSSGGGGCGPGSPTCSASIPRGSAAGRSRWRSR